LHPFIPEDVRLAAGLEWAAVSGCLWAAVVFRRGDAVG